MNSSIINSRNFYCAFTLVQALELGIKDTTVSWGHCPCPQVTESPTTTHVKNWVRVFPGGSVVKKPPTNAGDSSLIPDPKDTTCHWAIQPVGYNYWACALAPGNYNYWAHVAHLLKLSALEPVLHRNEATAIRSLHNAMKSSPHSLLLEKSPRSNKYPAQSKINKFLKLFFKKELSKTHYGMCHNWGEQGTVGWQRTERLAWSEKFGRSYSWTSS